jgi:hypothetical protein
MTVTGVPISVSEEAQIHIAKLGLQREFEAIVDRARQSIPGLQRLEVVLESDPEEDRDLVVVLEAYRERGGLEEATAVRDEWVHWFVDTFPPAVCWHFLLTTLV